MDDYERVASAIEFLIEHRGEQPSLDDIASRAGLSRFHFQRLFKRYAGITPKQFLAALTLESAKPLLDEDGSVLDVAIDIGLSSPGRLHDHFVSIDAMSPGEYKSGGRGLAVTYGFANTAFGTIRIATTPRGIAMLDFVDAAEPLDPSTTALPHAAFVRDDEAVKSVAERVFHHDGDPLRLHVGGTNFQMRVWNALLELTPGERVSYGRLAAAVGAPGASRAVGNALAANPVCVLIPCHRVIRASGALGNYKHGSNKKRALLAREAAQADAIAMVQGATV